MSNDWINDQNACAKNSLKFYKCKMSLRFDFPFFVSYLWQNKVQTSLERRKKTVVGDTIVRNV